MKAPMNKEINLLEPLQSFEASPNDLEEEVLSEPEEETSTEEIQSNEKTLRPQIKGLIEALLFASSAPLPFNKIREVTDAIRPLRPRILREILQELQYDYIAQQHSFRLEEIAQGYILRTCEEFAPYIDLMHRNKRAEKLSQAATEVLAIIAYKQPITRPQIDAIRGVDCSGTMQNLLDRQLIEPLGKLEAPGRPMLYGITKEFLLHFGLRDISELPKTHLST